MTNRRIFFNKVSGMLAAIGLCKAAPTVAPETEAIYVVRGESPQRHYKFITNEQWNKLWEEAKPEYRLFECSENFMAARGFQSCSFGSNISYLIRKADFTHFYNVNQMISNGELLRIS